MIGDIAQYASYICSIAAAVVLLIKPIREKIFGYNAIRDGQVCILRSEILAIYYKHCDEDEPTMRQYERENLDALYAAYKAEHGNSFIKDLYDEMRRWHIAT